MKGMEPDALVAQDSQQHYLVVLLTLTKGRKGRFYE